MAFGVSCLQVVSSVDRFIRWLSKDIGLGKAQGLVAPSINDARDVQRWIKAREALTPNYLNNEVCALKPCIVALGGEDRPAMFLLCPHPRNTYHLPCVRVLCGPHGSKLP